LKETPENILKDERSEIPNMRKVVHRGAAGVHANLAFMDRIQRLQPVRQRIVQVYGSHFRAVQECNSN
jgi:hypothetical protein